MRRMWAISCMAFHGSLPIGELLPLTQRPPCLLKTSLSRPTKWGGGHSDNPSRPPKVPKGVTVELFPTDTFSCPVAAFKKWKSLVRFDALPNGQAVREDNGTCITAHWFNKILRGLLSIDINYNKKRFLRNSWLQQKSHQEAGTLALQSFPSILQERESPQAHRAERAVQGTRRPVDPLHFSCQLGSPFCLSLASQRPTIRH